MNTAKKPIEPGTNERRKWTVMVYLSADNSLSTEFLWDLKEMQEINVGPQEDKEISVVAQYDPGQGIPTQRYIINKQSAEAGGNNGEDGWLLLDKVNIPIIPASTPLRDMVIEALAIAPSDAEQKNIKECRRMIQKDTVLKDFLKLKSVQDESQHENTGNPLALLRFICWGIDAYPADSYMVVLAGHGSGADGDFLPDATSQDSLTLQELQKVFKLVQKKLQLKDGNNPHRRLDILGMDSCLMSMVEVYYQLKGSVSYLVGAEGFEPSSGWPYQRILRSLANDPKMSPRDLAAKIVDEYVFYYFDYALSGLSVDLATCEIETEEKRTEEEGASLLREAISMLVPELKAKLDDRATRSLIISARHKAQSYLFDQYVDLWDFCDQLNKVCPDLKDACKQVKDAVGEIVVNSSYVGPDCQDSHGLSVYFPWISVSPEYKKLEFAVFTKWHEFVERFTEEISALQLVTSDDIAVDGSISRKTLHTGSTMHLGETLYMGYPKAPTLVWKPPKDLRQHVRDLRRQEVIRQIRDTLKDYKQKDLESKKKEFEVKLGKNETIEKLQSFLNGLLRKSSQIPRVLNKEGQNNLAEYLGVLDAKAPKART